ncbi:MFS transporter [uncultured Pseudokineococcus sp.]|uniref:MFS transporter n=1 Tax=uncultured Pseudokineococcus sp. TaxID=1642928 RepID=UPI002615EFA3|nr:MFS transporter [uncultured Pseudokineococcus sp.]
MALRGVLLDTTPLRVPAYRRLLTSSAVSAVGSQLTAVAVPVEVFRITGSSTWVGVASAAGLVPLVVFSLWGGSVADVVDRRSLMAVSVAGIAASSALLALHAVLGVESLAVLLGLVVVQQAFFGLYAPARGAAVPRLVPARQLPAAMALSTTVFGVGAVAGPLLAGALIPLVGLPLLYLVDALGLLAALALVLRLPAMPVTGEPGRRAGAGSVLAGLRYIGTRQVLLVSFLADVLAMVLGMPRALFPVMAHEVYGGPADGGLALGVLYAAIPVGSLLGGLFSGRVVRMRRHGALVLASVALWGAAVAAVGLTTSLWVAAVLLAVAGAADLGSMVFRGAILQTAATDEMRGRLQGVFTVVVVGGPRLADLLHGAAGDLLGARAAIGLGGLLVVVATGVLALRARQFRRYTAPA